MPVVAMRQPTLLRPTGIWPGQTRDSLLPRDLPDLQLWLAADRINGLADGNAVTTWSDLSGNGRDATQGTAAKKPIYKTNILNGLPVVRFDGVDDYLDIAHALVHGASEATLILVLNAQGQVLSGATRPFGNTAANNDFFGVAFSAAVTKPRISVGLSSTPASLPGSDGPLDRSGSSTTMLLSGVCRSGSVWLYDNGVPGVEDITVWGSDTIACNSNKYLGAMESGAAPGNYFPGDIAEVIVLTRYLEPAERQRVERYLTQKWGVA